jgi:HNH endonuclease
LNALPGQQVDHINGDTLDNREANLRFATKTQNQANAGRYRNNRSGYRGVSVDGESRKYRAQIKVQKRLIHLGFFATAEDAAIVHDAAAIWLHGALFVRRNLPHRIIDPNVFTHIQHVFGKRLKLKSS